MADSIESKDEKTLAWFLGPKAENAQFFEDMLTDIFRDYTYWRKNYFPEDPILITKKMQPQLQDGLDQIHQNIQDMMAELRRNFPFYSPRYFGHMLSEVTMPSMLAYFAGMLFNPNNVTTEAAPVTAEWEIEASNWLLEMLGFTPSPAPPKLWIPNDTEEIKKITDKSNIKTSWTKYSNDLKSNFGWGHITSGGTVANIEALWVARTIKYYPLAIYEAYETAKKIKIIYNKLEQELKNRKSNETVISDLRLEIEKLVGFEGITVNLKEIPEIEKFIDKYKEDKVKVRKNLINQPPQQSIELLEKLYSSISIELFGDKKKRIEKAAKSEIYLREIDELINAEKTIPDDLNEDIKDIISNAAVSFEGKKISLKEFKEKLISHGLNINEKEEVEIKNSLNQIFKGLSNTSDKTKTLNKKIANEIAEKYKVKINDFDDAINKRKSEIEKKEKQKRKKEVIHTLLSNTEYWTDLPGLMSEFPGYIFYPETAHYSIKKAADILGISRKNLIKINVEGNFRMNIENLQNELEKLDKLSDSKGEPINAVPIAVIGVFGTTEEGAIDPIDMISKCRLYYQGNSVEEINSGKIYDNDAFSFWIHVDAAYGGFFSSILRTTDQESFLIKMKILYDEILKKDLELYRVDKDKKPIDALNAISIEDFPKAFEAIIKSKTRDKYVGAEAIENLYSEITAFIKNEDYSGAERKLDEVVLRFKVQEWDHNISLDFDELIEREQILKSFSENEQINSNDVVRDENNRKDKWPAIEVVKAFKAIKNCNSVTIDPHKMGYIQYPCGFVAFKNDKIRNFITQDAPYITTTDKEPKAYQTPPRHIAEKNDQGDLVFDINSLAKGDAPTTRENYKVAIEAFASYILEGSKPGAAAAALWLTLKTIKPDKNNYGLIIKDTILASATLYNRIKNWNDEEKAEYKEGKHKCRLYPLSNLAPDTNVVVFFVAPLSFNNSELIGEQILKGINKITKEVYDKFTIHAEHGDRKTSYSQPFFLSQTKMEYPSYSYASLQHLFNCENGLNVSEEEYKKYGLNILRASMMNPYIQVYERKNDGDGKTKLISKFLEELNNAAFEINEDF